MAEHDKIQGFMMKKVEAIQEKVMSFSAFQSIPSQQPDDTINEKILERLQAIEHKLFHVEEKDESTEHPIVIKEIHIDKFYLDKYEQNNNIAQLGIKELSGALNIGATFGKDTIPKEMNEQLMEFFADVTAMKGDHHLHDEDSAVEEQTEEVMPDECDEGFSEIKIDDENDGI